MSVSMHAESEGKYGALPAVRCHSCTALLKRQKEYELSEHRGALRFRTVPYDGLVEHVEGLRAKEQAERIREAIEQAAREPR